MEDCKESRLLTAEKLIREKYECLCRAEICDLHLSSVGVKPTKNKTGKRGRPRKETIEKNLATEEQSDISMHLAYAGSPVEAPVEPVLHDVDLADNGVFIAKVNEIRNSLNVSKSQIIDMCSELFGTAEYFTLSSENRHTLICAVEKRYGNA